MRTQQNPTDPLARPSLARQLYPMGAVVATTACLVLWAVGYQHTIATALLVGGAAACVVLWRIEIAEQRTAVRVERVASDVWWHGYATCLEDTGAGQPERRVVPFRLPRGDRNGDSGRLVNGSEVP